MYKLKLQRWSLGLIFLKHFVGYFKVLQITVVTLALLKTVTGLNESSISCRQLYLAY